MSHSIIKPLLIIILAFFHPLTYASKLDLKTILDIEPGSSAEGIKELSGSNSEAEFEVKLKNKKVESVRIDFNQPVSPKDYVSLESKGFCLVKAREDHIPTDRKYFFNKKANKRYELTPDGNIKSILNMDFLKANKNPPCTFQEALKITPSIHKIKKVK